MILMVSLGLISSHEKMFFRVKAGSLLKSSNFMKSIDDLSKLCSHCLRFFDCNPLVNAGWLLRMFLDFVCSRYSSNEPLNFDVLLCKPYCDIILSVGFRSDTIILA